MQRNKIPILSTRPLSRDLISMAERSGLQIDVVPFIKTEPLRSGDLFQRIQELSLHSLTVVFTSMNAAETVIKRLNGFKPSWRIFCLRNTTRKTLAEYFGAEAIEGVASNATDLAGSIVSNGNIHKVVFFCGNQRREELPSILKGNGVSVEEVIVYKTIILNNRISRKYHGILFFSPSAVAGFFSNNAIDSETSLFAIGETTADTIRAHSNNEIVIGNDASNESLLHTVMEYYQLTSEE